MDEGGIYEEGTPEDIFNHPKKELTRRFIKKLKVFETVIDNKDYDFIGFGAELDRYLMQNDVTSEVKYRIRLAIEELVQQILLPIYDKPFIRVKVEYSSENGECEIFISYKGEAFDIHDSDNGISLALLKNTAKELEYSFDGGNDEPNCVRILIKQAS